MTKQAFEIGDCTKEVFCIAGTTDPMSVPEVLFIVVLSFITTWLIFKWMHRWEKP